MSILIFGIFAAFVGGYLSDVYPRRDLLMVAEVLHAACIFGMIACVNEFPSVFSVFYFLKCAMFSFGSASSDALFLDHSSEDNERVKTYTYHYWLNTLAVPIAAITGLFLYKIHLTYCLWLSLFLSIATAYLYLRIDKVDARFEGDQCIIGSPIDLIRSYFKIFRNSAYRNLTFSSALVSSLVFQIPLIVAYRLVNKFEPVTIFETYTLHGVDVLVALRLQSIFF